MHPLANDEALALRLWQRSDALVDGAAALASDPAPVAAVNAHTGGGPSAGA